MSLVAPRTPFEQIAARYIKHKRALGLRFDLQARTIGSLGRFRRRPGGRPQASTIEAWCFAAAHQTPNVRGFRASFISYTSSAGASNPIAMCPTRCALPDVARIALR
jgi:hypothetical protein